MEENSVRKSLKLIIPFIIGLLIIPFALTYLRQRQEMRKLAGEFPPSVVFVPRNINTTTNEDINLTLLIQSAGLSNQKLDAGDIIFRYPKKILQIQKNNEEKPITVASDISPFFDVLLNTEKDIDNEYGYVVFSFQTKLLDGKRTSFAPILDQTQTPPKPKDLVIGSVKFKALQAGSARIEFDILKTMIAGGGINNTNFLFSGSDQRDVLAYVELPSFSLLRVYPNKILNGYAEETPLTITGKGFEATQKIVFDTVECKNLTVAESGTKINCTLPTGLSLGNKTVYLKDAGNNNLATLDKGLAIYDSNTPLVALKIKFYGVNSFRDVSHPPANLSYLHQFVKVKIIGQTEISFNNVLFTAKEENDKVIYETINDPTSKIDDRIALTGFTPGSLDFFVKGPKQLQRKFTADLVAGDNVISRLTMQSMLMGGDLPLANGQDGKVNAADYNYIINHIGSAEPSSLRVADITLSGAIDQGDAGVIADTLGEQYDEDE